MTRSRGLRCNPAKLLLDPYARAFDGRVRWGPEVFDYDWNSRDTISALDSAAHVPKSLVVDSAFDWAGDVAPRTAYADSVIYEVHVKGFTATHPGVPPELRGTYAGMAHPAAVAHLTSLGVTAVGCCPSTSSSPPARRRAPGCPTTGATTRSGSSPHTRSTRPRSRRLGGQVREFQHDGPGPARGGDRGDSGRCIQPHGRGRRAGPDLCFRGIDNPPTTAWIRPIRVALPLTRPARQLLNFDDRPCCA